VDGKNIAVLGDEQACTLDSEIRMCVAGVLLSKQTALLLNEKLKFPNWTKKQIQGMPETLKQGITALGKDIPELPRDQLHAVPEAVWKSQVDRYAY
jgi:DNA replicative helicase MCM subunit Mcm2 (Cdc46/Mcm family)